MRSRQRSSFILAFLLPATALYVVFVLWPLAQAFVFSLYRWRGVSQNRTFVGLGNFQRLGSDPVCWQALTHNLLLFVFAGGSILVLAMLIAHALQGGGRATRLLRAVYLFPQVTSLVAVSVLWMFIYNPRFGLLNALIRAVSGREWTWAWTGEPRTALAAVGVAFVWHALGFYIMLFAAGLRTIPTEVYEAARLDGAEGVTRFRRVTLPMLWAVLRVALVYLAINSLNIFALVFLLNSGQPFRPTEVMLTYLYEQAFTNSEFGFATALAVANFAVVMAMSGLIFGLLRRDPQESAA